MAILWAVVNINFIVLYDNCALSLFQDGYTALHYASATNQTDILQLLLTKSPSYNIDTHTCYNETSLHLACLNGCLDPVRLLVEHRADLHARDGRGNTILHLAAANGSSDIIRCIIHDMKCDMLLNCQNKVSLL